MENYEGASWCVIPWPKKIAKQFDKYEWNYDHDHFRVNEPGQPEAVSGRMCYPYRSTWFRPSKGGTTMAYPLLLLLRLRRRAEVRDRRRDRSVKFSIKRFPNDVAPWPTTRLQACSSAVNVRYIAIIVAMEIIHLWKVCFFPGQLFGKVWSSWSQELRNIYTRGSPSPCYVACADNVLRLVIWWAAQPPSPNPLLKNHASYDR